MGNSAAASNSDSDLSPSPPAFAPNLLNGSPASSVATESGVEDSRSASPTAESEVSIESIVERRRDLPASRKRTFNEAFETRLNRKQQFGMQAYLRLLDECTLISVFLANCPEIDRYYIACVFVYFQRAQMHAREYNARKFAMALHIVNAVKEDDCDMNDPVLEAIYQFAKDAGFPSKAAFIYQRDCLLKRMDFRACVSLNTAQQVIAAAPPHAVWQRFDPADHDFIALIDEEKAESRS